MTEPVQKDPLRNAVGSACHRLQDGYFAQQSSPHYHTARANLAELRRGAGLSIEKNPLGLEQMLFAMDLQIDERLLGRGDAPSPSECAAYTALTLFAIHMQSASQPVHQPNIGFATACGRLSASKDSASIKPRFDAMLLATSEQARRIHIRSLVTLLRAENIGFDYGLFARDLRNLADPKKRAGVQLRWGRDFAAGYYRTSTSPSESQEN